VRLYLSVVHFSEYTRILFNVVDMLRRITLTHIA